MNKISAMISLLLAEKEAKDNNDIERAIKIREDYIRLCNGYYDSLLILE
jgi:hypothetical protein